MAKSKSKTKDENFELKAEKAEKFDDNEISDADIKKFAKNANAIEARKAIPQGEIGQLYKQFTEDGGHNKAMKWALSLQGMEDIQKQELVRNLIRYCTVLGVFDQVDFFDDLLAGKAKGSQKANLSSVN